MQLSHRCTCRVRPASLSQWSFTEGFQIFQQVDKSHATHCPLCKVTQQSKTFGMRYGHASCFLTKAIEVSFTFKRGAGGCSLSPCLRIRGIVRQDSPAFRIFHEDNLVSFMRRKGERYNMYLSRETETSIGRLRRLFEDGQAAPDDVDVKGRTVLQVIEMMARQRTRLMIGCM